MKRATRSKRTAKNPTSTSKMKSGGKTQKSYMGGGKLKKDKKK